jgi:hypothetical protein
MAPASDLDRSHNSRSIDAADHFLHTLDAQGTSLTARLRFNEAGRALRRTSGTKVISSSISGFVCGSSANAIRSGD